jgi:uncharacterized repeat protein (TIGR03837 family)
MGAYCGATRPTSGDNAPQSNTLCAAGLALSNMLWDIFCTVIDNHGDLGVCWRLSAELARRGEQVRLWVDDGSALAWMAPQGHDGVTVWPWHTPLPPSSLASLAPADVLVEAFGCEIDAGLLARHRAQRPEQPPVWINLEYLSAEAWVERCHALPSPVMSGPAAGWTKWFFYPGFTPATGGLMREPGVADEPTPEWRLDQRQRLGAQAQHCLVSLFCYEPPALPALLARWQTEGQAGQPVHLLVMPGRPAAAVRAVQAEPPAFAEGTDWLRLAWPEAVPQAEFDRTLRACDLNFVRGEDSVVRALWAGRALVWHIYPQDDEAHRDKLGAFLDWLDAPPSLRQFHEVWNGLSAAPLPPIDLPEWQACVQAARAKLLAQSDLVTQLLRFCTEKR